MSTLSRAEMARERLRPSSFRYTLDGPGLAVFESVRCRPRNSANVDFMRGLRTSMVAAGGRMEAATTPLERARALYDLISGEAREAELARRLTDRAAQALLDAGLFSMLIARSDGGAEASWAEFFETVEAIAKADGSAGWCLSVCAVTAFVVSRAAHAQAKREVFGEGPVALWTTLMTGAQSTAVHGGYRVSGRFALGIGKLLRPLGRRQRRVSGSRRQTMVSRLRRAQVGRRLRPRKLAADGPRGDREHRLFDCRQVRPDAPQFRISPCASRDVRRVFKSGCGAAQSGRSDRLRERRGRAGAIGDLGRGGENAPPRRRGDARRGQPRPVWNWRARRAVARRARALSEPARRAGSTHRCARRREPRDCIGCATGRVQPDARRTRHDDFRLRLLRGRMS